MTSFEAGGGGLYLQFYTFFNLFISITSFYSLHREIKTGNTSLVIHNNKYAIRDGFKGRKGRF